MARGKIREFIRLMNTCGRLLSEIDSLHLRTRGGAIGEYRNNDDTSCSRVREKSSGPEREKVTDAAGSSHR